MTPDASWEQEFHDWYNDEHIPVRMAVKGFQGARRYAASDNGGYLAVYEMDGPDVLQGPAYAEVKGKPSELTKRMLSEVKGFTRYTGNTYSVKCQPGLSYEEALDSPFLYSVLFRVPADEYGDFNNWYEKDHVPTLMECEDWLMVRRFDVFDGHPENFTHLALHHLRDLSALDSDARAKARASDWRALLADRTWFKGTYRTFRHMRSFESTHDKQE